MIRDYDEQTLKQENPVLYLQKKIDYDFWLGKKIDAKILKKHLPDLTIEPLLRKYLQDTIVYHESKKHTQPISD